MKHAVTWGHITYLKYISITAVSTVAKLRRVMIYNEELPLIKYTILQSRGFVKSCGNSNMLYLCTRTKTIGHGKVTYPEGLPPIKSNDLLNMRLCEVTWQIKNIISTISMTVVTKLVRVVTYCEELPPINSHDPLITWPCEVMWQIKYISPLAKDQWTPN